MLRHSPAFAITVLVTLALGIGATVAIFSVTDAALIKPLPFPEAQGLVSVYESWQGDLGSRFATEVLERVRSVPGGCYHVAPTADSRRQPARSAIERCRSQAGRRCFSQLRRCESGLLPHAADSLLEGRTFTDRDNANAPGAVIVNKAMAQHFWPGEDPVGKYIKVDRLDWSPVVGVIADIAQQGLGKAAGPTMYVPYAEDPWPSLALVLRTAMDPARIASASIAAIHQVDKDEPVYKVRTMQEVIDASVQVRRFRTVLLALFASPALAIATVGIYGVMAYAVTQRSREIGIRMAMGAEPQKLRLLILGEGLRLAGWGIAAGLIASLDVPTFGATFGFVTTAAFLAIYLPARRATKMDAASILRTQ